MSNTKSQKSKEKREAIQVYGLILSESYQRSKAFACSLHNRYKKRFSTPTLKGFLDVDWNEYLDNLRKKLGGQTWALKGVAVFVDDVFIGGEDQLFSRFSSYVLITKPSAEQTKRAAKADYVSYLNKNNLLYTYMEISMDRQYIGTLVFELRPDLLHRSATRFATLCDKDRSTEVSYKGTKIHRICKSGWFQAGKLAFDEPFLEDESYCYKHNRRGILSFTNEGVSHTNDCEFFVTFKPSPWMDGRYVAFGRVIEGSDVLRRIEYTECFYESPECDLVISDCGLIEYGLGRHFYSTLKMKGLTIGKPHIHLDVFVDLLFEKFVQVLFDRLDSEVKQKLTSEWMRNVIWESVMENLIYRSPADDVIDVKDKSSEVLHTARYLAGLYGMKDIPDHYISDLLDRLVADAVERIDITSMARDIGEIILIRAMDETLEKEIQSEMAAEAVIKDLIGRVNELIFGPEELSSDEKLESHLSSVLSSEEVKKSLADLQKRAGETVSSGLLTTKQSVVGFIWNMLLEKLKSKFEAEVV